MGLGSNLGDRAQLLRDAIRLIGERVGEVIRQSSFVETEPWGFDSDNQFMNAVVLVETECTPREVLLLTQQIERDLGKRKEHATQRSQMENSELKNNSSNCKWSNSKYYDRPIDIDILLYDDLHIDEPDLKIPHPLMHERDFVMQPLNEIR